LEKFVEFSDRIIGNGWWIQHAVVVVVKLLAEVFWLWEKNGILITSFVKYVDNHFQ
jgi:hypothetical protein